MQPDNLQLSIDALATRLGRSVAVDDPALRLIAASRHFGDEDPARVRSVLDRHTDDAAREFVRAHGIATWTKPGAVSAHPPHLSPRWCTPVRRHQLLLGYLWLIDPFGEVTSDELTLVSDAASSIAEQLYRRVVLHDEEREHTTALLRTLLTADDEASRLQAIGSIEDEQLLRSADDPVAVLAAEVVSVQRAPNDAVGTAFAAALEMAVRAAPPRSSLSFARERTGAVLVSAAPSAVSQLAERTAHALRRAFAQILDDAVDGDAAVVVGIGVGRQGLAGAHRSYRQAVTACHAAVVIPQRGPVVRWDQLGVYAALLELPPSVLHSGDWVPGLAELAAADRGGTLTGTLATFLDNAGDIQRTARQLRVHRTTLYHRLQRVEEITGMDLHSGDHRLTLHLGIKLLQFATARLAHEAARGRNKRSVDVAGSAVD